MTSFDYTGILTQAVDELSDSQSYKGLFHQHKDGDPLPSAKSPVSYTHLTLPTTSRV